MGLLCSWKRPRRERRKGDLKRGGSAPACVTLSRSTPSRSQPALVLRSSPYVCLTSSAISRQVQLKVWEHNCLLWQHSQNGCWPSSQHVRRWSTAHSVDSRKWMQPTAPFRLRLGCSSLKKSHGCSCRHRSSAAAVEVDNQFGKTFFFKTSSAFKSRKWKRSPTMWLGDCACLTNQLSCDSAAEKCSNVS